MYIRKSSLKLVVDSSEDYKENSALLCNVHQPGNNDSLPKKKKTRDIETLNICLFYLIFKNDLS